MLVTDLPTLTPSDYPGANCLRQEVRRALDYAACFPNSAANIKTFLAAVGTIAADVAPTNSVLPAITGTAQVGQTLTSTTGTWAGTPTPTFARQWEANGAVISGATAATYVPVAGDVGKLITVVVTATNPAGVVSKQSAATAAVIA